MLVKGKMPKVWRKKCGTYVILQGKENTQECENQAYEQ